MRILTPILGFIVAVAIIFMIGKNVIVKAAVEGGVKAVTGLTLNIQSLKIGLRDSSLGINYMKLNNPKGYEDKTMFDIPEVYVDYNLSDILKGNIHLEEVRLNLATFTVIKNREGVLNLDALKPVEQEIKKEKSKESDKPKEKTNLPEIQIDLLKLKVGKVIYKDYSGGGEPEVKEFNLNLDSSYTNITDPKVLVSLIVTKALMSTTIGNLANIDIEGLAGGIKGQIEGQLGTRLGQAEDIAKVTQEGLEKTWEGTQGAAKEITGKLKELF